MKATVVSVCLRIYLCVLNILTVGLCGPEVGLVGCGAADCTASPRAQGRLAAWQGGEGGELGQRGRKGVSWAVGKEKGGRGRRGVGQLGGLLQREWAKWEKGS